MFLEGSQINFFIAFLAGSIAFLSPCVWPMLPVYLSLITGLSIKEIVSDRQALAVRRRVIINSLLFALGFGVVFFILGLTATTVGQFFRSKRLLLEKIGGGFLILLGIYLIEIFKLPALYRTFKINFPKQLTRYQPINVILVGATFALGWSPCIGPVLATILIWTGVFSTNLWQGVWWLTGFTFGLTIPFLVVGLLISSVLPWLKQRIRAINLLTKIGGWIIILMGVLLILGWWKKFLGWVTMLINYQIPF